MRIDLKFDVEDKVYYVHNLQDDFDVALPEDINSKKNIVSEVEIFEIVRRKENDKKDIVYRFVFEGSICGSIESNLFKTKKEAEKECNKRNKELEGNVG